jgi:hypothetical protein
MDLDFDNFIQGHFPQLDALENARVEGNQKGEIAALGSCSSSASFCFEVSDNNIFAKAIPKDSCIEFAGSIRNALDAEVDDAAIVADKIKECSEDEEDTCSSSSQVPLMFAVYVCITRQTLHRAITGLDPASRFSAT